MAKVDFSVRFHQLCSGRHDIFSPAVDPVPVDQTLSEALQLSAHVNELYRIRETK
jgi:hypothetical protein